MKFKTRILDLLAKYQNQEYEWQCLLRDRQMFLDDFPIH